MAIAPCIRARASPADCAMASFLNVLSFPDQGEIREGGQAAESFSAACQAAPGHIRRQDGLGTAYIDRFCRFAQPAAMIFSVPSPMAAPAWPGAPGAGTGQPPPITPLI